MPFHDSFDLLSVFNRLNPQFPSEPFHPRPSVEHRLSQDRSVPSLRTLSVRTPKQVFRDCQPARSVYASADSGSIAQSVSFFSADASTPRFGHFRYRLLVPSELLQPGS